MWMDAGAEIGNHTYSHRGLNNTPIEEYEADILAADEKLRRVTGRERIQFFRSPMLQTGPTPEVKQRLERFLVAHGWRQAPVTFDNSDWMFAYVLAGARERGDEETERRVRREYVPYLESTVAFFEKRGPEVVGRVFPQVLLLHANDLNAEMLGEVLAMLRRRGYEFVGLREALADAAYELENTYAGKGGFSWIHRWSMSQSEPRRGAEPDEPGWLVERYGVYQGK
jgi:peptidoglycan/xylan/chitin deacetylase (PgdA/CDA1 family)